MYLTLAAAAQQLSLSPSQLRRRCTAGDVPGALQLGGNRSPWRVPVSYVDGVAAVTDSSPAADVLDRGAAPSASPLPASRDQVMSSRGASLTSDARVVADRLRMVTARPAVALADVLYLVAAAGERHYPGRDGWCVACSWQYPCADALAARAAVDRAHDVVVAGAR